MTLSHLLVAIVLFLLVMNVIFRIRIIRKYKALKDKQVNIEPGILFDRRKVEAFIEENHPQYAAEIRDFKNSLNMLIKFAAWGLLIIVVVFLLIKYS